MEKSLLARLLTSLNTTERSRLDKFIQSPYFNNRTEVVKLCQVLVQYTRKGKEWPDKTMLFQQIFGKKPFDDHRLRVTMSLLYQLICRFISLETLESDAAAQQRALALALRSRNLPERAAKALQQARTVAADAPHQNADALERQYQLALDQYRAAVDNFQPETSDLKALTQQLDDTYLARKLWQACFTHSHSTMYNTQFDHGLLHTTLQYVSEHPEKLQMPAIGLYYYCYLALTQPTEIVHFRTFMQIFKSHSAVFPHITLLQIGAK